MIGLRCSLKSQGRSANRSIDAVDERDADGRCAYRIVVASSTGAKIASGVPAAQSEDRFGLNRFTPSFRSKRLVKDWLEPHLEVSPSSEYTRCVVEPLRVFHVVALHEIAREFGPDDLSEHSTGCRVVL